MNINEIAIAAKAGNYCECETPKPINSRTIKDNIRETTEELFWFKKENVKPSFFDTPKHNDAIMPAALAKAFLNFTFGAPRASLGVKQVIFSGPKTIVFWLDETKTIVSCGEGDNNDPYAGFCAAVTKRVFGSTSQAKKVLARTRKETSK